MCICQHWLEARGTNQALAPAQLRLPWTKGDFLLRYLVGFDACAPGACNDADLANGKARLETVFDVVVLLVDAPHGWAKMRRRFGWPSPEAVTRSGTRRSSDARRELASDEKALAALQTAVGPNDRALYAHAQALLRG